MAKREKRKQDKTWRSKLWGDLEEFPEDQKEQFLSQVMQCENIFAKDSSDLAKTDLLEHEINTSNCKPVEQPFRWVPPYQQEVTDQQLEVF